MGSNGIESVVIRVLGERDPVHRDFLGMFVLDRIEDKLDDELSDDAERKLMSSISKAIRRLLEQQRIILVDDNLRYTLPPGVAGKHKKSLKRGKKRRTHQSYKKR
jgi:hypothetical protein